MMVGRLDTLEVHSLVRCWLVDRLGERSLEFVEVDMLEVLVDKLAQAQMVDNLHIWELHNFRLDFYRYSLLVLVGSLVGQVDSLEVYSCCLRFCMLVDRKALVDKMLREGHIREVVDRIRVDRRVDHRAFLVEVVAVDRLN